MNGDYFPELMPAQSIEQTKRFSLRDVVASGFGHGRAIARTFAMIVLIAAFASLLMPPSYQGHMRILVKNGRVDPIISAEPNVPPSETRTKDMEAALNSEAELLKSNDLLTEVVIATGLDRRSPSWFWRSRNQRLVTARATRQLAQDLQTVPLAKTNIIEVTYRSDDPKMIPVVLNSLANLYLKKHVELHQTPGQYQLFTNIAQDYKKQLEDAEAKIAGYPQVAPNLMRDMTAQKFNDANATLVQTGAAIKETEKRISGLESQLSGTTQRITTQVHRIDNQSLLQQLKSTLLNLQLKRTALLTKFQPGYRLVQELDKQIADTQAAIATEENAPAQDKTTDLNPNYTWINSELAKARSELVVLRTREKATQQIIENYDDKLKQFQQDTIASDDLQRAVNTAKDNYLLYVRKAEEARISQALDQSNILNVAVADNATEPMLPRVSRTEYLLVGLFLALVGSGAVLFAGYRTDSRYYRTPEQVMLALQIPVLAALPSKATARASAAQS
jgi:uncharacterized protein involved in exopolysaccharide biosynthesis